MTRSDRNRFIGFAFASSDVLIETSDQGLIDFAFGALVRTLGYTDAELQGRDIKSLLIPEEQDSFQYILENIETGTRLGTRPITIIRKDGKEKRLFLSAFVMPDDENHLYLSLSDPRLMPERNYEPDGHDEQTRLRTRSSFIDMYKQKARTRGANTEEQLSLLMIKGLEKLRDEKGLDVVDQLMQKLASRLKINSLAGDSAGLLADGRIGIMHEKGLPAERIQEEASKLIEEFSDGNHSIALESFSIDLKVSPSMSEEDATRAMVYAINQFSDSSEGNFKLSSLDESANILLNDTLNRVNSLRKSMIAKSFQVALQPIVHLETNVIHHYEALTRFEGGKSPAQIISFAEEVDMIEDFDLLIIQRILTMLSKHAKNGWRPHIAVNVSGKSMSSDVFIRQLRKIMMEYGNIREQLSFEITETAKISDMERLNRILQMMRKAGHKIYLDDVGAGNTTFQTIHMVQADAIKIEGQYVQRATNSLRDMAILKSITNLAQQFGTEVVGEMIDSEDQVTELLKLNVKFGQGYLFGKPTIDVDANTFGINGYAVRPTTFQSW